MIILVFYYYMFSSFLDRCFYISNPFYNQLSILYSSILFYLT